MKQAIRKNGFTLIETLVASTIFCGAVLTISAICSRSLTNTRLNRRYETALSLINRQLSIIDYLGIDEFLTIGEMEGEFEDYEPRYYWNAVTQYENIDSLYYLRITVSWLEHTRVHSVSVDTMFNGISAYAETDTEQAL